MENTSKKTARRWSENEEKRLIQQVMTYPQNLNACFIVVSEVIGRTPTAVAAHWYAVTSKRSDVKAFVTASSHHLAVNRKNGKGIETPVSIWRRILRVIKDIC